MHGSFGLRGGAVLQHEMPNRQMRIERGRGSRNAGRVLSALCEVQARRGFCHGKLPSVWAIGRYETSRYFEQTGLAAR